MKTSVARIESPDAPPIWGVTMRLRREPSAGWRMFGISPGVAFEAVAPGTNAPQDVLFVAPALASSLQGRPIEEVVLLRDEMANMAWAIERSVEGAHGLPMDRAAAEDARRTEQEQRRLDAVMR